MDKVIHREAPLLIIQLSKFWIVQGVWFNSHKLSRSSFEMNFIPPIGRKKTGILCEIFYVRIQFFLRAPKGLSENPTYKENSLLGDLKTVLGVMNSPRTLFNFWMKDDPVNWRNIKHYDTKIYFFNGRAIREGEGGMPLRKKAPWGSSGLNDIAITKNNFFAASLTLAPLCRFYVLNSLNPKKKKLSSTWNPNIKHT